MAQVEVQTQPQQKVNEAIMMDILKLIEQNVHISFRQLFALTGHAPEDIWRSLKELQSRRIIESIKVSNTKTRWKIQYGYMRQRATRCQ